MKHFRFVKLEFIKDFSTPPDGVHNFVSLVTRDWWGGEEFEMSECLKLPQCLKCNFINNLSALTPPKCIRLWKFAIADNFLNVKCRCSFCCMIMYDCAPLHPLYQCKSEIFQVKMPNEASTAEFVMYLIYICYDAPRYLSWNSFDNLIIKTNCSPAFIIRQA